MINLRIKVHFKFYSKTFTHNQLHKVFHWYCHWLLLSLSSSDLALKWSTNACRNCSDDFLPSACRCSRPSNT
eukprot:m.31180 g.31180  ORF g.31180 m.31180 type:complete len:72 (+) comp9685_c0_seq1:581-796(+)